MWQSRRSKTKGIEMTQTMTEPLADWFSRLQAKALELRLDPRVTVTFSFSPGISNERLAKLEESWKVDAFCPAIRNLYTQVNGLCFLWISTHHPDFPKVRQMWEKQRFLEGGFATKPSEFNYFPTTSMVDSYAGFISDSPNESPHGPIPYGVIYMPPLEKVLAKGTGFIQAAFGHREGEDVLLGRSWRDDEFERAIRVFDYPRDYSPAGFVMTEGDANPPVLMADDHSDWRCGAPREREAAVTFESYMEMVLASLGRVDARRDYFSRPSAERKVVPFRLEDYLPPSVELQPADDGSTFEVKVDSTEQVSARKTRVALVTRLIPGHRVKHAAKVLDLKPLTRKADVLIEEIVDATADPTAISSAVAGKLMTSALCREKTKAAFLQAFGVGMQDGEEAFLTITTLFDAGSLTASELDASFRYNPETIQAIVRDSGVAEDVLGGAWVSYELLSTSGRGQREAKVKVSLSAPIGLQAGQIFRSCALPAWFRKVGPKVYRSFR